MRRLLILRAGGKLFAVDADALAHGTETMDGFPLPAPVPLPGAPAPVRGVVQVRGRLYTVIDPAQMLADKDDTTTQATDDAATPLRVIPLRGKEQLALAIERIEGTISISGADIELFETPIPAVQGVVRGIAEQDVLVLDLNELFAAATQGMERRRRRS